MNDLNDATTSLSVMVGNVCPCYHEPHEERVISTEEIEGFDVCPRSSMYLRSRRIIIDLKDGNVGEITH